MMSVQSSQSTIAQIRRDLASLEKKLADELKREASKKDEIHRVESNIGRNTSPSSISSKRQQIVRLTNDLARIHDTKADIAKRISGKTNDLHRYEQQLTREQASERKRIEDAEKRRERERLDHERAISREISQRRLISPPLIAVSSEIPAPAVVRYDAFISRASEDKDEFARPLATELQARGYEVWYDEFTLKVGDSLRRAIDRGLSNSRFGIVGLSSAFFAKNWPQYELDGMVAREMRGVKVILPIWHKVSKDEVMQYSPSLADKVALNSTLYSVSEIADRLEAVLGTD